MRLLSLVLLAACTGSSGSNPDGSVDDFRDTCADEPTACRWAGDLAASRVFEAEADVAVFPVGDVDDDGWDDLIVQLHDLEQGELLLLHGPFDELREPADAAWRMPLPREGDYTRDAMVAEMADLTGDGVVDLAVGSTRWGEHEGELRVIAGPLEEASLDEPWLRVYGTIDHMRVGRNLLARDLTGDGQADLAFMGSRRRLLEGPLDSWEGPADDLDDIGYNLCDEGSLAALERQGQLPAIATGCSEVGAGGRVWVDFRDGWLELYAEDQGYWDTGLGRPTVAIPDTDGDGADDLLVAAPFDDWPGPGWWVVPGSLRGERPIDEAGVFIDAAVEEPDPSTAYRADAADLDRDGVGDLVLQVGLYDTWILYGPFDADRPLGDAPAQWSGPTQVVAGQFAEGAALDLIGADHWALTVVAGPEP